MNITQLRKLVKEKEVPYTGDMNRKELESFLSDEPFSYGWRWNYIYPVTKNVKERREVVQMLLSPVREFSKLRNKKEKKKIENYLREHNVILTLTTSPKRLLKLTGVFATIDLSNVTKINVVLPKLYGSKKEEYKYIPQSLVTFPKVEIIRINEDMGPITKMLPTIVREQDRKALVISIDDDVAYPMGMVNELIYQKVIKHKNAVLTMGVPMPFFSSVKNMRKYWPERHVKRPYIDIAEGWSSVLYTPHGINDNCMEKISHLSKECFLSDDFVISYVLALMKIKRVRINNKYAFNPVPYDYGAEEDALHAGRDISTTQKHQKHSDEINFEKYTKCLSHINDYVKRVKENKELDDSCHFRKYKR